MAELVRDEKENFDWFPWRTRVWNTDGPLKLTADVLIWANCFFNTFHKITVVCIYHKRKYIPWRSCLEDIFL